MRTRIFVLLMLSVCLALNGCGKQTGQSPAPGELEQYLQENPEAAKRVGEPEGINDPVELPGEGQQ